MSEKFIPEHVDPYRYADQGLALDGSIKMADTPRLSAAVSIVGKEDIAVKVQFGVDEQGITFLKGQVKVQFSLQCQRCMQPYIYEIMSDFVLGVVKTLDEANALPESYEPAVTKEGQLALRELIEDEIILNLPMIPRHEPDTCPVKLPLTDSGLEQERRENPFHVLAGLKDKRQ